MELPKCDVKSASPVPSSQPDAPNDDSEELAILRSTLAIIAEGKVDLAADDVGSSDARVLWLERLISNHSGSALLASASILGYWLKQERLSISESSRLWSRLLRELVLTQSLKSFGLLVRLLIDKYPLDFAKVLNC